MGRKDIIVGMLIAAIILLIAAVELDVNEPQCQECRCSACILYDINATFGINGIYQAPDYYCVWTTNRTAEEINKTIVHELCHDLVYRNYGHYCESEYVKWQKQQ